MSTDETTGTDGTGAAKPEADVATVEAMVRAQMSKALGGKRGMLEAAIPGLLFTAVWLPTKELQLALVVSLASAGIALAVRLVQRSTLQYVLNAVFSIGIGYVFVRLAARGGGSADDQALAFFLPGILYSLVYTIVLFGSVVARWPAVGFMLGSVTGDPTAWHDNRQVVKLCGRLTLLLGAPGAVGVLLQGPVWVLGWQDVIGTGTAVAIIAALRYGLGWPLRIASWSAMVWLLARNATPLESAEGQRGTT
ncbi:DUF3159 domain-containing protein [Nocardioides sp.]|uniref:DUF3159 domain-containing protein n=1 Tax=Nocardioides sp. TaxID=35761 RepID=UPI00271623DD|nr:DUF3159 domain-containing protein [Nocardioides sp.]MDO9456529.1 DUF3159 domain-containing protein [Nocardioides sp.]